MDKQSSLLGRETPSPSMTLASSTSTDTSAATPEGDGSSPVHETPISPVSPPSPHKLKKKRSKKNSESETKSTLSRAISLTTSSMVTPVLNASGPRHSHSRKKAASTSTVPPHSTSTTGAATPAVTTQKPNEKTPPMQGETLSPSFDMSQLAEAITQVEAEPRAKSAPPTPQLSHSESLLSKPLGSTRGKMPKPEGTSQRAQPYGRQPTQSPHQQIPYRNFTAEEKETWDTLLKRLNGDKAHLSWLENDAGNTDTAKLAVLKRIIAYMDQYGTMPMEVTIKSSPNAKGGVEKVVCGLCRQEKQVQIKEYPTVQKAAVHITSNHWEMQLWVCIVPGCEKAFRCRDGIQNPKRHMDKMHPNWLLPKNPDPSNNVATPAEQTLLTVPSTPDYVGSLYGTEYLDPGAQYPESSQDGYPSTSYQAPYIPEHVQQLSVQQSQGVYIRVPTAPPRVQPSLMPVASTDRPEPSSFRPPASPSRSQGRFDILSKFAFGGSQTTPTVQQSLAMTANNLTLGSVSPSEMASVVPAPLAKRPGRSLTGDLRRTHSTGMPGMMEQSSLPVVPGRARNVSNPTTMHTTVPFQIPIPPQPVIPRVEQVYPPAAIGQMYQPTPPVQQMYQPPYAPSSHSASLSPQQFSPGYAQSIGYGQTPESYLGSPPQKMPSTSPNSQTQMHFAYPSPASTQGFSTSPPYASHMPPSNSTKLVDVSPYLSLQTSGQHSPNPSSRSSHSSSPYPPMDDPLLGFDLTQNGQRTSVDGGSSGGGQSPEYGSVVGQVPEYIQGDGQPAPLSSALLHPSLGDPLQLVGVPLSAYAPPSPKKAEPLSAVEMGQLINYFDKVKGPE